MRGPTTFFLLLVIVLFFTSGCISAPARHIKYSADKVQVQCDKAERNNTWNWVFTGILVCAEIITSVAAYSDIRNGRDVNDATLAIGLAELAGLGFFIGSMLVNNNNKMKWEEVVPAETMREARNRRFMDLLHCSTR
jgi:hypothetical protein